MDKLLVITLLVVFAGEVFCQSCKPACVAADTYEGSLCDCSEYYYCLDTGIPSSSAETCPLEAPYFDNTIEMCGNDPLKCTADRRDCPVSCVAVGDYLVDPSDCSSYYFCDALLIPQGPVPCQTETPVFNGKDCITDPKECCAGSSDLCEPYCDAAGKEIIDPNDCTKYYICFTIGPASELEHNSCPTGENFDIGAGHCVAGVDCITMCQAAKGRCAETLECTAKGLYRMCPTCQKGYFDCLFNTGPAIRQECSGDMVFNPDLSYPYCVSPDECPHQA